MVQLAATLVPGVGYAPSARPPTNAIAGSFDGTNYTYLTEHDFWRTSGPELALPGLEITPLYNGAGLTVSPDFFGAHWHNWPNTSPGAIRVADDGTLLDDCGYIFNTVRTHDYSPNSNGSLRWHAIEPTEGDFVWSNYDKFVNDHAAAGRVLVATMGFSPPWASTAPDPGVSAEFPDGNPALTAYNRTKSSNPPDDLAKFGAMCGAVASRFPGLIDYYEIWNEADGTSRWFNGTLDQLAQMTRIGALAIKAADPNAKIVVGALTNIKSEGRTYFQNWMNTSDGDGGFAKDWVDAVSFHIYQSNSNANHKTFSADMAAFKAILTDLGLGSKELMCSEGGLGAPYLHRTTDADVRRRLMRMFLLMAAHGVSKYLFYDIDGPVQGSDQRFGIFGGRSTAPMVAYMNELRTMLLTGEVTLVNHLWDGRVAYIRNGKRLIA